MGKIVVGIILASLGAASAQSFDDLALQASRARDASQISQAEALYRQALALKPGWAEGWSLLGLCEFETGGYDRSLADIRRGLNLGTGIAAELVAALRFHEAQLLTRAGLFDQALEKYSGLIGQGSVSELLFRGLGLAALRTPLLVKAIPADRERLFSTAGAVVYLWMSGQAEAASKSFRGFIATFPTTPNVHTLYGMFLLPSQPDEAMSEFKAELDIDPRNAEALASIAQQLSQREDPANALTYAERAVQDSSAVPLAQYVYGILLTRKGDVGQGINHLETAEKFDPQNLDYHLGLAEAYSKAGRVADARRERTASIAIAKGEN